MFENAEKYEVVFAIAESENDEPRSFLLQYGIYELDKDGREDEDEPDFFPAADVSVRELSEEDLESLYSDFDENELGTLVCALSGLLIMSNLMKSYGYDPHDLCDAQSQNLEYLWSALTDPTISDLSLPEDQGNIFYVDEISIEPDYFPENDESAIVIGILENVISLINEAYSANNGNEKDQDTIEFIINGGARCVDTIAYYPPTLPYYNSAQQKKIDLYCCIVSWIRNNMVEKPLNPDTDEWDLLEAAGWYECGNSRLLYKTCFDN